MLNNRARLKGFFRNLPRSANICLFCSTAYFVMLEVEYLQRSWLLLHTNAQPQRAELILPLIVLLPWASCLRGLWLVNALEGPERRVQSFATLRILLAVTPTWSYLLFSIAGRFRS